MNQFAALQHAVIDSRFPKLPGGMNGQRYGFAVEISSAEVKTSARGLGDYLIVEFKILYSNCPEVREGEMRSWSQKTSSTMAAGEMLAFLAAVSGMDKGTPTRIDQELRPVAGQLMQAATDQRNLLQGLQVGVETEHTITVTNKQPFVKHHWAAMDNDPVRWATIVQRLQAAPNAAPRPMMAPPAMPQYAPPPGTIQAPYYPPQGMAPPAGGVYPSGSFAVAPPPVAPAFGPPPGMPRPPWMK